MNLIRSSSSKWSHLSDQSSQGTVLRRWTLQQLGFCPRWTDWPTATSANHMEAGKIKKHLLMARELLNRCLFGRPFFDLFCGGEGAVCVRSRACRSADWYTMIRFSFRFGVSQGFACNHASLFAFPVHVTKFENTLEKPSNSDQVALAQERHRISMHNSNVMALSRAIARTWGDSKAIECSHSSTCLWSSGENVNNPLTILGWQGLKHWLSYE